MRFTDTLHVCLRASSCLRVASLLAHIGAFTIIAVLAWFRPMLAPVAVVVLGSGLYSEYAARQPAPGRPVRLRWAADHRLNWQDGRGREHVGECVAAQSWGTLWVRLKVRERDRRFARMLVIPFDATDADTHRRLRARCRVMPPGVAS